MSTMKPTAKRASMVDNSVSTFSDNFCRFFNHNDDPEESLLSLLEDKIIPREEEISLKRPTTLMVKEYEPRRSFHKRRKDPHELQSPVCRRRSCSIAVPQPTLTVDRAMTRSVSPKPPATRSVVNPKRNRTASMPAVSKQKEELPNTEVNVSVIGAISSAFWLLTLIVIDVHLFRSRVTGSNGSYSNSTVTIMDLTLMTIFAVDMQLYSLCKMLQDRFMLLNVKLKSSVTANGHKLDKEISMERVLSNLKSVFSIYWKLIELLEFILMVYRLQIFLGLCLSFLHLLIDVYLMMYSIMEAGETTWLMALNFRPICYLFRLVLVSVAGSGIKNQPMLSQIKRQDDPDGYYRLRSFSITPNGICKNLGDSLKSKRSRSSCSVDSTSSLMNTEMTNASSQDSNNVPPVFTVGMLGAAYVGKTTLSYQFTTSEYICAYDTSLDDEFGQKTVSMALNGKEAEINIIDIPAAEMSVETFCYTFNVDVFVVVYSIVDKESFKVAEDILLYLWNNDYMATKGVILVGNKADLERRRVIPTSTGRKLALTWKCKFIETSSGLDHNVNELLVGIFSQVQLNPKRSRPQTHRNSIVNGKQILKQIMKLGKKAKSCENLYVL